ncbi:NAD(P)-dependent alcohol dehydrogenase [Hazenella sp. IB182357]|uniref:NAD(P)-dependent alcohol dehydrogenase n=1 Tax=Polycladospora coralii TaxID=2771432 RepID=A0A926N7L2_9BACL|nr:NAD(P)-dependent alcohol dehydrogenase [Polycladospora coralii]MBD1373421.1 NAD(P)-dependent alcohol dehydrogenase [Polycladospora coralii]
MKAIVYTKYGSPDVLQLKDVEQPIPNEEEVLVQVYAASANPLDWHKMRADPFITRLGNGLFKPKNTRPGADIAGRVIAVGKNVTQFKPGDGVFGDICEVGSGGFAEYVAVPEHALVLKPSNLSFIESAAVPVAALTALQGLRHEGQIQAGQKVLVNGASGGVGTFAVQIAKAFGAEVTGVCSTQNLELVSSIGATHVIDYTKEDFTRTGVQYDLIYDAVGNRSVLDLARSLQPHGVCTVVGITNLFLAFQVMWMGKWISRTSHKKIGMMMASMNKEDLQFIKELVEAGKVAPVIDRRYPLSQTADAIRYLETGRARGKVVITMV